MATLTTAQKDKIRELIVYMQNGYEKPLDAKVVEVLETMQTTFGYPTAQAPQTGIQESLRDAPFSTLLTMLLNVAA